MVSTPEDRLEALHLHLPEAPAPVASYVRATRSGNLIFTSGQLPSVAGVIHRTGLVGAEVSVQDAADDARTAGLNALAVLKAELGELSRVRRIVKLTGFVASAPGFTAQPKVVNGASDLMVEVFGEAGRHARSAVGVAGLPLGATVEIELVAEVDPEA